MKLQLLTLAMLSVLAAGCSSSSSSTPPADDETQQPNTDQPPGTDDPGTDDPGTDDPGTDDPGTNDPGTDDPGTDDPGTDDPGTDDPGTDDPGTNDPGTDDPGTDDPGTDDPGTDDPGTNDPGTDSPPATGGGSQGFSSIQGNVQFVGFIEVENNSSEQTTDVNGGFLQFSTPINAAAIQEGLADELLDQCDVSVASLGDFDEGLDDLNFDIAFDTVSAGETVTMSSSAGSYGELQRMQAFGFTVYQIGSDLTFPSPSPLTFDVPGDVFPAFSNVSISAPPALTGVNIGAFDPINASTTFTWDAVDSADSTLTLDFSTTDFATFETVSVSCVLTDDGSFSLPASTVAELNQTLGEGWSTFGSTSLSRVTLVVQQQGNAVLVLSQTAQ